MPFNPSRSKIGDGSECIKVCVRVRPLLPRELGRDEVIYFPSETSSKLEGIKVADGQHLIESKYDKVYAQRTPQDEIY